MAFTFDAHKYSYASTRQVVYGNKGMVATSQPLAAQIGLDILKQGGNAIDAAVATAAAMTVLEPTGNGIGGDAFALVWVKDKLHGLNASGPAPMAYDTEKVRKENNGVMPLYGWSAVTVPGIPSSWVALSEKFGKLPFEKLMEPAVRYAREGYPVSPTISTLWKNGYEKFKKSATDASQEYWFKTFAPDGKVPKPGDIVKLPDHADTLEEIGKTKGESFYRGAIADKIDDWSKKTGGFIRKEDLAAFYPEWVEPIKTNYKGYDVWEIPPNGHGIVALMAMNILEGYSLTARDITDTCHKQIEAMKLAFVDGQRYVTDPRFMKVTSEQLLSKEYAAKRRELIGDTAIMPEHGDPSCGGTIYLCTADSEGNMVSFIQSNYHGFGSGVLIPHTGIGLQNRAANFNLDPESENCAAPGKKPYHTIIPGFLSKDGKAVGPFGVMGGFMQPQGHLQVIMNTIDFGMNPQEALDAPRWQWVGGKDIEVEAEFPNAIAQELARKGHNIKILTNRISMGRGQIIWRNEEGVLVGATEPRADGAVAAW